MTPIALDTHTPRTSTVAIILHHTDGPDTQTVAQIRAFHMRPKARPADWPADRPWTPGRGWDDIGYHVLIRLGARWPGRPLEAVGAHAPGWNQRSVGVALVGRYSSAYPPPEQLEQLYATLAWLLGRYPGARILRHDEAMAEVGKPKHTRCPGVHWEVPVLERLAAAGIYRGG